MTTEHVHLFDPRLPDRFWDKVHAEPNTGCWLWLAAVSAKGYGSLGGRDFTGTRGTLAAHRVAYDRLVGPIPPGLFVLHRCDTPACVNVAHLFLGTKGDNNADMIAKGRDRSIGAAYRGRTHCKRGHEFTPGNTRSEGGFRRCRTCTREASRRCRSGRGDVGREKGPTP
jgi:hypothetical protein